MPEARLEGGSRSGLHIRPREFAQLGALIESTAGIHLGEAKKPLVVGRLSRRLRALGLDSFGAYYEHVRRDPDERTRMVDCIATNETHFFREPRQFEFLEQHLLPAWVSAAGAGGRPRRLRIWSAACSTGEEPYSLAMTLLARLPAATGWHLELLASDVSTRALEQARAAVWPIAKAAEIPPHLRRAFMLRGRGPEEGRMKAGPELRAAVQFAQVNLNDLGYAVPGGFDAVFCRNVLIYFDPATKVRVVEQLLAHLDPGGCLFLGHAESLIGLGELVRTVGPNVYTPRAARTRP